MISKCVMVYYTPLCTVNYHSSSLTWTHTMLQVAMCTRRGEERGRCGFYIGAMAPPGWTHVEAHTLFIHSEYLTGDLRIICTSRKTQHTKCSISKSKKITRPSVNYANDWLDQFLFPSLEKCSTLVWSVGRRPQRWSIFQGDGMVNSFF